MLLQTLLPLVISLASAFDSDLWTPYDEKTVASMIENPGFSVLDMSYTLEPFIIYIHGDGNTAFAPQSIQNAFSVYYNYTDYNYIERVQAIVVTDADDLSNIKVRSDTTLANDSLAPAYYIHKVGSCQPQGVDPTAMTTTGHVLCGTLENGLTENNYEGECTNPDGNYALYSSSTSSVTGYGFDPGCGGNGNYLTIYLAPDMFFVGTYGQGCHYEQWEDCASEALITTTCKRYNSESTGYVVPYNYISPYYGNDQISGDGIYKSTGYCETSASGDCFVPTWN